MRERIRQRRPTTIEPTAITPDHERTPPPTLMRQVSDGRSAPSSAAPVATHAASTVGHDFASLSVLAPSPRTPAASTELKVGRDQANGGAALDRVVQAEMEGAFGHRFADVRIHTDEQARALNRDLNADAVTAGREIYFREGAYQPGTRGGRQLLAHELAHVVQQGSAPQTLQTSRAIVSDPSDAAEQLAARAGEAFARGAPLPDVRTAPSDRFYRAVTTNGGVFDTTTYAPISGGSDVAGSVVGADIDLTFTPNDLVEANTIGLTQTVKTMRSTATSGGAVNDPSNARRDPPSGAGKTALNAGDGPGVDIGRGIDRTDFTSKPNPDGTKSTLPNTNPMYGAHNTPADPTTAPATPAGVSTALTDTTPGSTATFGSHKRKSDGTFDAPVDAELSDGPRRVLEFDKQQWTQSFETTAIVLDGPMANTYLGSVAWGWRSDASANTIMVPTALSIIQAGAPTSDFMDAATKWNTMKVKDPTTGTEYDTVDLPTTFIRSGSKAAPDMTTQELLAALATTNSQIAGLAIVGALPAVGSTVSTDQANANFEQKALEAELKKRKATLDVRVISTEDWIGSDDVYAELTGPGGVTVTTETKKLNDGESHSFSVALEKLLPLNGPIKVKIFDKDWPDSDDLIVDMSWDPPFDPAHNTASLDDANYAVELKFER